MSDSESDFSTDGSEFSDDSNPPWQDEIEEDGELFYVEEDRSNEANGIHDEVKAKDEIRPDSMGKDDQTNENAVLLQKDKNSGAGARLRSKSSNIGSKRDESLTDNSTPIKSVFVSVESPSSYDTKDSSLLRQMLGIISLTRIDGYLQSNEFITADSLIVSAMMPDGPALRCESIDIGDVLLAINNVAVFRSNIEQVLQRIPCKMELRLTIHCGDRSALLPKPVTANSDRNPQDIQVSLEMLRISSADNTGDKLDPFQAVFYLTLNVDSETGKGEEDIIYMYPKDSLGLRKLKSTRGVFTTLADVATDAFKSEVRSSVIFINEKLVHCAYCRNGSEVLVICVPGSLSLLSSLHNTMSRIVRLLKVMNGSLTKAFESPNWIRLNHLFNLIFTTMPRSGSNIASSPQFTGTNGPLYGINALKLDDRVVMDIDGYISEFEAAYFDDGFHSRSSTRRLYSILGTCLFYKGYMISSHIPEEDLKDVLVFCQSYCLFNVSNVERILIWREVFPTCTNLPSRYAALKKTRYFYLIIRLRQCLLCVSLESGGCSLSAEAKPRPPLLYINHATAVILNLEKVGMLTTIDNHISRPSVPAVAQISAFMKKSSLFGGSSEKPTSGSSQPAANQGAIKFPFLSSTKRNPTQPGSDTLYRSNQDAKDTVKVVNPLSGPEEKLTRLTVGDANTLFHYVYFDVFSGALLTHSENSLSEVGGTTYSSILRNFHHAVVILHDRLFFMRKKNPNHNVYEEGSMFHCSRPDKSSRSSRSGSQVHYWVIGRCIRSPKLKEFYLCFHDWMRQDTTELAFQLGFGIAG